MTYRTIVVGTDGSATARIAERTATLLARAEDADLLLASAYTGDPAGADERLAASTTAALAMWPRARSQSVRGNPADALVALAREAEADLLVVGNKGIIGGRLFLGSVPDRVSHNAPCDLLIVNTTASGEIERAGPYRRMLIATDASETSLEAVRRGFGLATELGAVGVLFYAGHPKTAEIVFREVARSFLPAATMPTASGDGDPADALCDAAKRDGYDLMVLGNKGMLGGGLHLGSVPNKVSHQAPTDLLLVRTVGVSVEDLRPGQGSIVELEGEKVAAYKDAEGRAHLLSARCAHMGCIVGWNSFEATWDCPCHGSRYDALGNVIRGPATRGLTPIDEAS